MRATKLMRNQSKAATGIVCVLGRILLCTAFLATVLGYTNPSIGTIAKTLAAAAALAPRWVLGGTVVLLSLASLSVVVGYRARIGALALLVFLGLTTYHFHGFTFWNVVSEQARQEHILHLVLNLSVMGSMLVICANGPGRMSFDGNR
jgi:putative oxidoreductase